MSFKEVKELRINGKLEEALILANSDLASDPSNVWNIRSISWVYYDFLKINSNIHNYTTFIEYLEKIFSLELQVDDLKMLHENIAIQIGKIIYSIFNEKDIDSNKVDRLFELTQKLAIGKPSNAHSFLIKAFLKGTKKWSKINNFFDFIGFNSFQENDFKSEEFNGRAISSVVEKFYNGYAKNLIDLSKDGFTSLGIIQLLIIEFLPKLDLIIEKHPEFQFLPYFKAKMLILMNRKEEVLETFLPFAKRKKNEFWVWEVIAELFTKEDENNFACHCKALSLSSPEEYLVGLRKDFALLLISKGLFSEAKYEINKVISIRNKMGWKIPNDITGITNLPWYNSTPEITSNSNLYSKYTPKAESILFQNTSEETVVVEFVNSDKNILNFVKDETKFGFFSYKGMLQKPIIGDVLRVRFDGDGKEGRFKVLSIVRDNSLELESVKLFNGKVRKQENQAFAFIDKYFVDPQMVEKNNLINNQEVNGKAILSFNKKKNQWGWKVISISQN